jgi:hypothetical protein
MLKPLVVTLTAKRNTAPTAIRSIDVPIAMLSYYPEFRRTNVRSTDVLVHRGPEAGGVNWRAARADRSVDPLNSDHIEVGGTLP